jgi:hypothetical protein
MTKLTDTQCVLLSNAAKRDSLSIYPLPDGLKPSGGLAKAMLPLSQRGLIEARQTEILAEVYRKYDDQWFGLYVTPIGLTAIGVTTGEDAQPDATPQRPIVAPNKAGLVVGLLRREAGATLDEMVAATSWLPHTTRAALTGLRKKGHAIERGKREDATCYFIRAAA